MIALSVGTFVVNLGLMLGALYHKRELLVPWLVYYTLLFVFCFFVRLPAVDEEVSFGVDTGCRAHWLKFFYSRRLLSVNKTGHENFYFF
jgi:hypothetical protein